MSEEIRVAVIGTGQIGVRHLEKYGQVEGVKVVAVSDIRDDHARRMADRFGVPDVYPDYNEMLKRDDIHAVDVCLHNRLHCEATVAVLESGKHCYCEKPMSWTYAESKIMYDAAKSTGKKLHIQLARLYEAESRAAKRIIDEGLLGDIYFAKTINYRRRGRPFVDGYGSPAFVNVETSGGGAMLDMAVYHISLMLFLLGNPDLETVSGATYQKLENMDPDRRIESNYNVEELGMAYVRLAGGISLMLEEAWAIHSDDPANEQVMGSRGGLRVDPLNFYTTLADLEMDGSFNAERGVWRWEQCDPLQVYYSETQKHWIGALQGHVPLIDTAGIALNTALITEGVYLSSHLGREVTKEEIENAEPGLGREHSANGE
jgi:predicted dehydrogenase